MDHGKEDGGHPPAQIEVHKDKGVGDGGAAHQASKACTPTEASLDSYPDRPPELVPVDITDDVVTAVAGRLSGGSGPGGTDSVSLQHWLLRFRAAIGGIQFIVGYFIECLSNGRPQWVAYCAMTSGRLITLEKHPGIIKFIVGETWRWLMVKCLLRVTGQEAKAACGTDQLDQGVEAGIEGSIHVMIILWQDHLQ